MCASFDDLNFSNLVFDGKFPTEPRAGMHLRILIHHSQFFERWGGMYKFGFDNKLK